MASTYSNDSGDAAVQRLIDQGRRNGGRLGIEQMGAALPIETMTPEEVAAVVERLETAGIEVDLEDPQLRRRRGDYRRGDGVVDMASPAAPAVSAPGAVPSRHGWADEDDALGHRRDDGHGRGHGHGAAPTWERNGVVLLPVAALVGVAVVLIAALG